MSTFTKLFENIGPEDYINSFLVSKRVRVAYLIQDFEGDIKKFNKRVANVKKAFPNLYLLMNSMGTFLSNKPLSSEDVKTNAQIGELLGFECGNKFDELDQENQITYTFEIIVTLKTGAEVNLITFVCRDMSTLPQNELLKNSIERLILADNNLKNVVEAVKLNITENKPLNYLISKLMDMNSDLDTSDIDEIINELNNVVAIESETLDIILPYLDMRNPVHVGIILAFLATLKHDPMSVFFPLQTTGRINEIKDIELLRAHTLSDILKQSSLDYQSFKRDR